MVSIFIYNEQNDKYRFYNEAKQRRFRKQFRGSREHFRKMKTVFQRKHAYRFIYLLRLYRTI